MYTGIKHTHVLVVTLFLLIYLIKTIILLFGKEETLQKFTAKTKVFEMIVSLLFLLTGIYLALNTGNKGDWLWIKLIAVFASIPIAVVAFKKRNKVLAVLSLLLICYAYGVSETKSATMKKEVAATDEFATTDPAALGKSIFESRCAACHGADGKLGLSGSKDLTQSVMTLQDKINIIKEGKNSMFAFKDQLTDDQIKAVAEYTGSLKK